MCKRCLHGKHLECQDPLNCRCLCNGMQEIIQARAEYDFGRQLRREGEIEIEHYERRYPWPH
jgi:hypothetical protein